MRPLFQHIGKNLVRLQECCVLYMMNTRDELGGIS